MNNLNGFYDGNITATMIEQQMERDIKAYRRAMDDDELTITCDTCGKDKPAIQIINNVGACDSCIDRERKSKELNHGA